MAVECHRLEAPIIKFQESNIIVMDPWPKFETAFNFSSGASNLFTDNSEG